MFQYANCKWISLLTFAIKISFHLIPNKIYFEQCSRSITFDPSKMSFAQHLTSLTFCCCEWYDMVCCQRHANEMWRHPVVTYTWFPPPDCDTKHAGASCKACVHMLCMCVRDFPWNARFSTVFWKWNSYVTVRWKNTDNWLYDTWRSWQHPPWLLPHFTNSLRFS